MTCEQITLVGRHLPEGYQVAGLIRAAGDSSNRGATLAQLYLDRCYRLMEGNDQRAHELEQKIRALEDSGQGSVP